MNKLWMLIALLLSLTVGATEKTAYEVWNDMTEAAINQHERPILVKGTSEVEKLDDAGKKIKNAGQTIMFGGEKEGSSALITRIMGPNKKLFQEYVEMLPKDTQEKFLRSFLSDFVSGKTRVTNVLDVSGKPVPFDLDGLKGVNFSNIPLEELQEKFKLYLDKGGDKHFSHLKKPTRIQIFNGKYASLSKETGMKKQLERYSYSRYEVLHGKASKYIAAAHGTSVGWEINFIPQRTYGEFEGMVDWFRDELKNTGKRFEAPGHQWVVYPKSKEIIDSPEAKKNLLDKVAEVHKNSQAYIVLKSIEGNAGIELANHKGVHGDSSFNARHDTGRGVIRLENNRFKIDGEDAFGIEYRAGVKSDKNRRKTQKFLISRYAASEFDDIANGSDWLLRDGKEVNVEKLVERFNVSALEAELFIGKIESTKGTRPRAGGTKNLNIKKAYLVPFWQWENAPYLSNSKKEDIKKLTRSFIRSVNSMDTSDINNVRKAIADWAKVSRISHDIEAYLKPEHKLESPEKAHIFKQAKGAKVDVNKIDMGIEYSARFPLKTSGEFVEVPGQLKKFEWQKTHYDYDMEERKKVIREFTETLGQKLNDGKKVTVTELKSNGHGHGLDIAYEVKDKEGRKWRAEWDGIGRNYDLDSNLIGDSIRGGHVEIVTPKFVPTYEDKQKLFSAMKVENLVPQTRFGGGHINIDLKPFEGKPKKFARFIGSYLDNRHVMSMLFQHPGRQVGAEAFEVKPSVIKKLKNFNGSEEDLKKLLYNEKLYNTRVGRKTKNSQMNLTAYFQDVIPEEFIHEDFDMKNDPWRRTFDVDPNIRKVEFRMFNAPRNPQESALQIKFAKALLNQALNSSEEVFVNSGKVDYEKMARNPEYAFTEYEKTIKKLGLDVDEYKGFFVEGLEETKNMIDSPKYIPVSERLKIHPKIEDWKVAVDSRKAPIESAGRKWDGESILNEAKLYAQKQYIAREAAEKTRDHINSKNRLNRLGDIASTRPIELSLTLDDIKGLPKDSAIASLYYHKDKVKKNESYKNYLKEILNTPRRESNLEALLKSKNYSAGFKEYLLDNLRDLKKDPEMHNYYGAVLNDKNNRLRARAISELSKNSKGQSAIVSRLSNFTHNPSVAVEMINAINDFPAEFKKKILADKLIKRITLVQLAKDMQDVRSQRLLQNVAISSLEKPDLNIFHAYNVSGSNPVAQQASLIYLKNKDPARYFKTSRNLIAAKETRPELKKSLALELKKMNSLKELDVAELKNLSTSDKLPVLHAILNDKDLLPEKRIEFEELILDKNYSNLDTYSASIDDLSNKKDFQRWALKNFKESNLINEFGTMLSDEKNSNRDALTKIARKTLELKSEKVIDFDFTDEIVNVNDPELEYDLKRDIIKFSKNQSLVDKAYKDLFNDVRFTSKVKSDSELLKYAINGLENPKYPHRLQALRVLKAQLKRGDPSVISELNRLLTFSSNRNEPLFKSLATIAGNNFNILTYQNLETLVDAGYIAADSNNAKIVEKAVAKNRKILKNLNLARLQSFSTVDQIRISRIRNEIGNGKKLTSQIAKSIVKQPDLVDAIIKDANLVTYNRERILRNQLLSYPEVIAKVKASEDGKFAIGKVVLASIRSTGEVSPKEAKTLSKLMKDYDLDFIKLLAENEMSKASDSIYNGQNHNVQVNVAKLLASDEKFIEQFSKLDAKTQIGWATITAKTTPKAFGDDIEKIFSKIKTNTQTDQVLKALAVLGSESKDGPIRLARMLANRHSSTAFETRTILLKKSKDPEVKKLLTQGQKNYIDRIKEINDISSFDTHEKLKTIFNKSKIQKLNSKQISALIDQVNDPDGFEEAVLKSKDTKYRDWLLEVATNKDFQNKLELESSHVYEIFDKTLEKIDLSNGSSKRIHDLLIADETLSGKYKLQILAKSPVITTEALDVIGEIVKDIPNDKRIPQILKTVLVDNVIDATIGKKASLIMNKLPKKSVNEIVKYANKMSTSDRKKAYILIGASKTDSGAIKKLAKANKTSTDPFLAKAATKALDKTPLSSAKAGARNVAAKVKACGGGLTNVLQRLSLR